MYKTKMFRAVLLLSLFLVCVFPATVFAVDEVDTLVRVAFEPNLPPYQFLEDGSPEGIHIDLMDRIAEKNHYTLEYFPLESQSACLSALNDGKVDIVLGVIPKTFLEYREVCSDSFSELTVCALTKKSRADLIRDNLNSRFYTTSYQFRTIDYEYAAQINMTRGILAPNQLKALDYLISDEADIMIGVKDTIQYQLDRLGLSDQYTIISNFTTPLAYTASVPNRQLRQAINLSLQQMQFSGEYEDILNRWALGTDYMIHLIIRRAVVIVLIILTVFLFIAFFNYRLNFLLKKQVNEKTMALQQQIIQTQNSNELRNKIFENSPLGIVVFGKDFSISLINSSACGILDLKEAPIGKNWDEFPLFVRILTGKTGRIMSDGESFVNQELRFRQASDRETIFHYDIYQLYAQDNTIRGAVLFFQDVTEETQMKEQLYERQKSVTLNRLIAGIAHEVRNPLTAIKSFVELLPQAQDDPELRRQITDLVPREVDRIHKLLSSLTDYAKPGQNNKEAFEVGPAIQTSMMLIRHMIEKEQIQLNVKLEPGLVICADLNQFRQVLLNVVINGFEAIQALPSLSPDRCSIDVAAWQDESYVYVEIADYGIGMTDDEMRKAMDPFYTQKMSGTGLGLYLSKQYVEENQGTLELESVKNKYTKVHITFRRLTWEKTNS